MCDSGFLGMVEIDSRDGVGLDARIGRCDKILAIYARNYAAV